jgi:ABC-2 type transport system permease protein
VELVLGKTIPFALIALLIGMVVTGVGIAWFQVPFRGGIFMLVLGTITFLFSSVGLGLFISTISSTQQQAMMAANLFLMPAILLSGLVFPIANMPVFFQYLTTLNPLMYYIIVVRGIFLIGAGLSLLWPEMLSMMVLGLALLVLAVARFQRRLA